MGLDPLMRLKSWTGIALAATYALVFAGAYVVYIRQAGQFLADLPVIVAAMPYLYVARAVTDGAYSFSGDMTEHVLAAAAFCCALSYVGGWIVESAARAICRVARRR